MKAPDGYAPRTAIRAWLLAASLGCLSLTAAQAGTLTASGAAAGPAATQAGNTWTFGAYKSGGGSDIPYNPPSGAKPFMTKTEFDKLLDQPVGRNFGQVPVSGRPGVPVTVTTPIPKPSAGAAMAKFMGKLAFPISAGMAAYELYTSLNLQAEAKPDGGTQFKKVTGGGSCDPALHPGYTPGPAGSEVVCEAGANAGCTSELSAWTHKFVRPDGSIYWSGMSSCHVASFGGSLKLLTEQELADEIASQSGWPTSASQTLRDSIQAGESVQTESPTVTGPATSPAPQPSTRTETVSKPDGNGGTLTGTKTTTTTYSTTNTYNNSSVTINTTTNQTSITNWSNGTTTTEQATEEKPAEEEEKQEDPCEANPDRVGCKELGDPDDEDVPKDTKNLTYEEMNLFGSGACPANLTANLASLGKTVTVWDWTKTCEYALPLRALILALASFAAFLIVMPGRSD